MNSLFIHPFLPQKKLFKAYDIRGEISLFTDDFVWALARSFAQIFMLAQSNTQTPNIVIGYDVRYQSQDIAKFLAFACRQQGLTVHWLGLVTTPMMAYIASQHSGNGIMITASHSQKNINGIKWLVNYESPSSQDIQALFESLAYAPTVIPEPALIDDILTAEYPITSQYFIKYQNAMHQAIEQINRHTNYSQTYFHAPHRIVIDCLNGATSQFANTLFTSFGYDCIMLNAQPNGSFPKGNPDPTEEGRLLELSNAIINYQADIGLAFDGDGDRLMVMDKFGQMISPDNLLYLLSNIALKELPNNYATTAEIIFDVKCSHHVPALIAAQGAIPVMEKTGSSLMRKTLQNKSRTSIFAGELSGHFIFNDGYFVLHDDAMYAAVRLLNWLRHQSLALHELITSLPQCVSTADLYLPIATAEEGQKLITRLVAIGKKPFRAVKNSYCIKNVNTIDGLRLDFPYGFGILRKSNTGNFLTVRFSGNNLADLKKVQALFVNLCRSVDNNLADQVAQIEPV